MSMPACMALRLMMSSSWQEFLILATCPTSTACSRMLKLDYRGSNGGLSGGSTEGVPLVGAPEGTAPCHAVSLGCILVHVARDL
jgi:hypothetical protein